MRPLVTPAPEFPPEDAWVNAKPLTIARLRRRRVVLLAFINTANINSLRALKALEAWDRQYGLSGLMVIGVHTPEYGFQKDPLTVAALLKREGVRFPVVLDNDRRLWDAYRNEGWPEFYLIDYRGRIIYDHLGEDRYEDLESEIVKAIRHVRGYPVPTDKPAVLDASSFGCGQATAEVDAKRSRDKMTDLDTAGVPDTLVLTAGRQGQISTRGRWRLSDGLRLAQKNGQSSAFVRIIYVGTQALATLAPAPGAGPAKFWVRQDDLWLADNAGADVRLDRDGRSYVVVSGPAMYRLVENQDDEPHELTLIPAQEGSVVYSWSFSDKCLRYAR